MPQNNRRCQSQNQLANGSSHSQQTKDVGPSVRICQLNIEGISRAKCDYLSRILTKHKIDVVCIQETHTKDDLDLTNRGSIPGYSVVTAVHHPKYGIVTYARSDLREVQMLQAGIKDTVHTSTVQLRDLQIMNIYKPPLTSWPVEVLPNLSHPSIFCGDFNSHHVNWRYKATDSNGAALANWADLSDLHLVFDAKDKGTFVSARWNQEYNPDLTFVSRDCLDQPLPASRTILPSFPNSQHRPIILDIGIKIPLINSMKVPRWNFNKANWESFRIRLDNDLEADQLEPQPGNYKKFVELVIAAAKATIPRGYRKEYIPGWNTQSEELYGEYQASGNHETGAQLLKALDDYRKDKWTETVESMDFKYSSRKAWRVLNRLTDSKESKSSAKNVNTTANRKDLSSPKVNYKSKYLNESQPPLEVSKTRPVKEPFRPKSGKMPSKDSLRKNQVAPRESDKDIKLGRNKAIDNVKISTSSKKSANKLQLAKLASQTDAHYRFLEKASKHKPTSVIHVPREIQNRKENITEDAENDSQKSLEVHAIQELQNKVDCCTETEKDLFLKDSTIGTALPEITKAREIQIDKETQFVQEDLCKCVESLSIQTDFVNETFDSLAVPNVTLTKDKSSTNEEIFNFRSNSLPNLHVPSLKITQHKTEESQNSNICQSSYFISHATVTCTTRQKINFHVVGNSSETISNQSPSPLAYPINVVSIFEKEMKRQKQNDNSFEQRESNVQYTNCLNEVQSLNCSYVLNSSKLVKPSDIISTIKITHGLLQNEYICEQFQRELNFIDSFFESLQYLESCSLTDTSISEKKVESLINNPDFDVNHLEYGSFISKLENGANVDDSETMASKSLCLLNLLIRDEQRRAKNLLFVLKMREDALKDFTKSQILWLENKKRQENIDISTLKKKQRGALLKLQHECGEMQRMRKALLTQSEKRKVALMKTKKNIELKLKNNVDVDQIILGKKKLKRNITDRNTTPLKCFDLSSSGCEESSASKLKSDIPLPETSAAVSVSSAEKCIQTGESKLETVQSANTAAENFVVVDGGYLNILFNNLSVPEIFSSNMQYEVNEEALRNIVLSTNMKHNFNELDVENLVNQIKNTDMESSSPSTARSLVEELDQYYKGLVEEKSPVQPVNYGHFDTGVDSKLQLLDNNSSYSLCTVLSSGTVVGEESLFKEDRQCIYDPGSVLESLEKEILLSARQTGPLPVPAGAAAGADLADLALWSITDSSSSSASDVLSASSQPYSPNRTSLSSQCEAEELRRQQLAIEREIKALEQQQSQLLVVREIPDKPPPPYTPPADARTPRLPRKYVADETTEEKIQKYMRDPHTDSCDPTDAFDTFVKDFCIETLEKQRSDRSDKPWDACNLLPQKPQEDTEKLIKSTSSRLLDILTGVGPVSVSGVGGRRSDHIDDVLFAEWRRCEPEWTSLQSDEAFVKNQIFEGIFQKILTETIDEYKRTVMCDE